jgi:predicted transcriptional regulator
MFSTNKISQAVNRQKAKEDQVLNFRKEKSKTYTSQLERENLRKKFFECNFHLAKTNTFMNLKNQNNHILRHINQYFNEFYYEQIEKEEEDLESSNNYDDQGLSNIIGKIKQ